MTLPSRSNAPAGSSPEEGSGDARLHIRDIKEMPAGHDEEMAVIFREMRGATGMSAEQLSAELGTSPQVIAAMEAGDILALPEWTETARIITAYALKLSLDSRPVLRRLKAQMPEPGKAPPQSVMVPPAASSPPSSSQALQHGLESQSSQSSRTMARPRPDASQPAAAPPTATSAAAVSPSAMPPSAVKGPPLPPGAAVGQRAVSGQSARPPVAPSVKLPQQHERPRVRKPDAAAADRIPMEKPVLTAASDEGRVKEEKHKPDKKRARVSAGTIVTWILLLGLFAGMGFSVRYASTHPGLVWRSVDKLPQPAPRMIRSLWELVRPAKNTKSPEDTAAGPHRLKKDSLLKAVPKPAN